MTSWTVSPKWKKSLIEIQYWMKGDQTIRYETGWRGGSFTVYTDDDNPPVLEEGVDIYNCGYETELIECFDGCWDDYEFNGMNENEIEEIQEFLDENSIYDLEEHGWYCDETEMIINCEMEITKDEE